ncbi:phenylacetic acid degradation protein [Pilimelia terevasa]|uniref:Phenylacetic acid degradation protein n=1 Tax=Pilimelia terevasa TaxID=53372 RepID=A0A8J3FFQ0_9ACTN|nr:1,2-phenylacetyl-CoA epoxidase subunit PaaC [Pilimelia terevasa]GGK21323.1 phenylacetic acid degradation protein [Pilimelia terevasa]
MSRPGLFDYLLALGDDALVTAQRLGEWYASSPAMEEDIALANIALDQLGAARLLLSYAAEVPDTALPARTGGPLPVAARPLDEDALAYRRDDRQFRNALLTELPHGDFAHVVTRLLLLAAYQVPLYDRLAAADDPRLAAIAAKTRKEVAYHLDHAATWVRRLGDGTAESHGRAQAAVDALWPYTHELFAPLAGGPIDPATLRADWERTVTAVLAEATLARPADGWAPGGGRDGLHTEHLSYLLAEMQSLHRAHPGARW